MQANRTYKDSVFSKYFSEDHRRLVELYNALEGTSFPLDTEVQITTLSDVLFKDRINDLSFTLGEQIVVLIEHQSTVNLNMALRLLLYLGRVYEKLIPPDAIYKYDPLRIPMPKFIVLYNGTAEYPEHTQQRLSDSFLSNDGAPQVELIVDVWNINWGSNAEMLSECRSLSECSRFIACARDAHYVRKLPTNEAVAYAVHKCIKEGIMEEFLTKNGSEVENMLCSEWNWDTALKVYGEESFEKGIEKGKLKTLCEMYADGEISIAQAVKRAGLTTPDFLAYLRQFCPNYQPKNI